MEKRNICHNTPIKPEYLFWIATLTGITGAILNSLQYREGFILWLISNPLLAYQAYQSREWNLVAIFIMYLLITLFGLMNWR
jgi:nicotinamide riboside transporter PnuC